MKKKLILLAALFTLVSCEKEYESVTTSCECGTIANDGISGDSYWIEVRNNCTSNKKRFYMDQDLWMNTL
jgi:hypothetical protein